MQHIIEKQRSSLNIKAHKFNDKNQLNKWNIIYTTSKTSYKFW